MSRLGRAAAAAIGAAAYLAAEVAFAPLAAQQPEPSKTLMPGNGAALTMAKCSICHDITHVTRSRLSRDEWDDNIKVMIARGMPIEKHEIPVILDYLATYYNRDKPAPAAEASADRPAPAAGPAVPPARLLADSGCMVCHALESRLVGPAFQEIASRNRGDPGASSRLAAKVREGGAGVYGPVPMPPHPHLAEDDLKRIVAWVLQQ